MDRKLLKLARFEIDQEKNEGTNQSSEQPEVERIMQEMVYDTNNLDFAGTILLQQDFQSQSRRNNIAEATEDEDTPAEATPTHPTKDFLYKLFPVCDSKILLPIPASLPMPERALGKRFLTNYT